MQSCEVSNGTERGRQYSFISIFVYFSAGRFCEQDSSSVHFDVSLLGVQAALVMLLPQHAWLDPAPGLSAHRETCNLDLHLCVKPRVSSPLSRTPIC